MRGRGLLFLGLSAVLVASGLILLSGGHDRGGSRSVESRPSSAPSAGPLVYEGAGEGGAGPAVGLVGEAGRFVRALMLYEVGDGGGGVERVLRQTATPSFARELLSSEGVKPVTRVPQPAVVGDLHFEKLTTRPETVLVSGVARRASGPEEFGFVFVRTDSGWRAGGPGA